MHRQSTPDKIASMQKRPLIESLALNIFGANPMNFLPGFRLILMNHAHSLMDRLELLMIIMHSFPPSGPV